MSKIGRPTKYDDSMPEKVYAYIDKCSKNKQGETRDGLEIARLPLLCGLATYLKVNIDTVFEWRKSYVPFTDACKDLLAVQKDLLIQSGLAGSFNSTIAARILGANHGMSDKKDITTNGKDLPGLIITLSETIDDE